MWTGGGGANTILWVWRGRGGWPYTMFVAVTPKPLACMALNPDDRHIPPTVPALCKGVGSLLVIYRSGSRLSCRSGIRLSFIDLDPGCHKDLDVGCHIDLDIGSRIDPDPGCHKDLDMGCRIDPDLGCHSRIPTV